MSNLNLLAKMNLVNLNVNEDDIISGNFLLKQGKNLKKKVLAGLPTIPSTIKEELDCNIFLRTQDLETFSKLRDLKDNF